MLFIYESREAPNDKKKDRACGSSSVFFQREKSIILATNTHNTVHCAFVLSEIFFFPPFSIAFK